MAQGTRATVSIPFLSQWKCSACGAENAHEEIISGYGSTNKYDEFLARKRAQEDLEDKLQSLQSAGVPNRYDKVCFNGKCTHCGNREPWSKTQSILFDILKVILVIASLVSVGFLLIGFAIPVLIVAACWVALCMGETARKNKVRNAICQLPVGSLPVLQPIQPQRPEVPVNPANGPAKQNATDYTEDELKQLPTWKRLELMKQRENENKENS